jgi:hypothetical protein
VKQMVKDINHVKDYEILNLFFFVIDAWSCCNQNPIGKDDQSKCSTLCFPLVHHPLLSWLARRSISHYVHYWSGHWVVVSQILSKT